MITDRRTFLKRMGRVAWSGAITLSLPRVLHGASSSGSASLERCVAAMGTTVSISAYGSSRDLLVRATSNAFAELYRLDRLLSVFRPESDINRLNAVAGERDVTVDPTTSAVLLQARRFHEQTRGRFDATVEPLMRAWGFRNEKTPTEKPDAEEIARLQEAVGMQHVHVSDAFAYLDDARVKVDLGGIAVGFTVDRIADILRNEGVTSALINHGGDICALGAPPNTEGWDVVLEHPAGDQRHEVILRLKDTAISTSSNARSFRTIGSRRVGHILDPRTGVNPHGMLQLSVIAPFAVTTDALSTGLFMVPTEHALRGDAAQLRRTMSHEKLQLICFLPGRTEAIWV